MKRQGSSCENCANYIFDDQTETYYCDMNLDEDEMARFLTSSTYNCPYFDFSIVLVFLYFLLRLLSSSLITTFK